MGLLADRVDRTEVEGVCVLIGLWLNSGHRIVFVRGPLNRQEILRGGGVVVVVEWIVSCHSDLVHWQCVVGIGVPTGAVL